MPVQLQTCIVALCESTAALCGRVRCNTPSISAQVANFLGDCAGTASAEAALRAAVAETEEWLAPEATVFAERLAASHAQLLGAVLGPSLAPRTCAVLPVPS
jgi:hypothetical protein